MFISQAIIYFIFYTVNEDNLMNKLGLTSFVLVS